MKKFEYKCDRCKQTIFQAEYKRNQGLCNECIREIN